MSTYVFPLTTQRSTTLGGNLKRTHANKVQDDGSTVRRAIRDVHEYVGQVECEDDHAVEPQRMCKVNVFRLLTSELRRNPKDEPPDRRGKKERQRVQLVEKMVEL